VFQNEKLGFNDTQLLVIAQFQPFALQVNDMKLSSDSSKYRRKYLCKTKYNVQLPKPF
jgi:hypothetical protein